MIKKKYRKFADDFEDLCEKYAYEDFNGDKILEVCKEIIEIYCE